MSNSDIVSRVEDRVIKDITEKKQFKATPGMALWLDTAIRIKSLSPTDIERECQENNTPISRENWYMWRKQEGFTDWFTTEWNKRIKEYGPQLDVIGMKQAGRDYKYWESMQRRVGNITDKAASTTVAVQNNINLDKYMDET